MYEFVKMTLHLQICMFRFLHSNVLYFVSFGVFFQNSRELLK